MTIRHPNKKSQTEIVNFIAKSLMFGGIIFVLAGLALYFYDMKMIGLFFVVVGSIEGFLMPKIVRKRMTKNNRNRK